MDITLINRKLIENYGKDFLNQPIYRVVWSSEQLEKRLGNFRDFIPGTNILLREVFEVRECQKYAFLDPQWVLEKLFVNKHNNEILDNNTLNPQNCTYEPLWAFGHENGRAKRPVWRAIEFLIMAINNPTKLTPSQMDDAELARAREDEKIMMELLNTHIKSDPLHSAIKDGDAIMMNEVKK